MGRLGEKVKPYEKICRLCGATYYGVGRKVYCDACRTQILEHRKSLPGNRQKELARLLTSQAIRSGELIRQPCEICDRNPAEAHHQDYSRPLEVTWFCKLHHTQWHLFDNGKRQLKEYIEEERRKPPPSPTVYDILRAKGLGELCNSGHSHTVANALRILEGRGYEVIIRRVSPMKEAAE